MTGIETKILNAYYYANSLRKPKAMPLLSIISIKNEKKNGNISVDTVRRSTALKRHKKSCGTFAPEGKQ